MDMFKQTRNIFMVLASIVLIFSSCKDPYPYDDSEPEWLGASIYDYLDSHVDASGNKDYTYYVRIIDSCRYKEVLSRTGSKTMFVCHDDAFERFFRNNELGVTRFEDFTREQLNQLMEYSMVNEANLIELLSYGEGYEDGAIMRRTTSLDPLDLVSFEKGDQLNAKNPYFAPFRQKGIHILNDNSSPSLVQFFQAQMDAHRVTDEDFSILFNGAVREKNDAHLFDRKIIERDITCKNGYIHVLEELLMPQPNMAEFIRHDKDLTTFNALMDRYSAPYADESNTNTYRALHPDFPMEDTIYVRRYFAANGGSGTISVTPDGVSINSDELLLYDPGWNGYTVNGFRDGDMGAMFVPDDEALAKYFSATGEGSFLFDRYKIWDSMPNDILALFLNAHMKYSYLNSIPSRFEGLKNESLDEMGTKKEHVKRAKVASNGVVYVTNTVYPPVELSSVMAPVLVGENTHVFNYPILSAHKMGFDVYLKSMESVYHPGYVPPYTFIVPYDDKFAGYIYPATMAHSVKEVLDFEYDPVNETVKATRYEYDPSTGVRGGMYPDPEKAVLSTTTKGGINDIVKSQLNEMMDYHIIVGELNPDQEYYETKGKGFIRVKMNSFDDVTFYGGGNMELNRKFAGDELAENYASKTLSHLKFRNGDTYFIDRVMQQPLTSVYAILASHPEFSSFFNLIRTIPAAVNPIFETQAGSGSSLAGNKPWFTPDFYVNFLTAYHYTLYVPDNDAMDKAFAAGLPTWSDYTSAGADDKKRIAEKLLAFIKYHFQDNSVYIKGAKIDNERYESSLKNNLTGRFYSLYVTQDGEDITLIPTVARNNGLENKPTATDPISSNHRPGIKVTKTPGLYNIMARDMMFCGDNKDAVVGNLRDYSARVAVHRISDYLSVIKAPVVSMTPTGASMAAGKTNLLLSKFEVSDNGDGVVYNGTGEKAVITHRGVCWSLKPHPEFTVGMTDCHSFDSSLTKDVGSVARVNLPKYTDMVDYSTLPAEYYTDEEGNVQPTLQKDVYLYIRAYAKSRYAMDGTDTLLPENAGKDCLIGYSSEFQVNLRTGEAVTLK